jgi:acyl-CoA synthetase (AMP-forming)/AMP-acid ligase II
VEEVVYATGLVTEVAAAGVAHPVLGQAVVLLIYMADKDASAPEKLMAECKRQLPTFMVPAKIISRDEPLPRNPNGKIDRKKLAGELAEMFEENPL